MLRMGTAWRIRGRKLGLLALVLSALLSGGALLAPATQAHPQVPINCTTTREYDNLHTSNWQYLGQGVLWELGYDKTVDSTLGTICQLRAWGRIFTDPVNWTGTSELTLSVNGSELSGYPKLCSPCGPTSPYHVVYRGPWVSADSGVQYVMTLDGTFPGDPHGTMYTMVYSFPFSF
jgi:hypothetical protein